VDLFAPATTRRRFLRLLGQGALAAALPAPLWAADADTVTLSILHTTDLHGHILPTTDYAGRADLGGLARCASQIRQWRRDNPNSLLLDIGDVYQGTELGLRTRGATMIRCLNALNYDAWVVGNHEFDWGPDAFAASVAASHMPVLSGNARVEGKPIGVASGPLAKIRPWLLKEIAGIRLAVISATTPALTSWLPPENLAGFEVLDPIEALRPLLREIAAAKPDAIVLAGHMGLTRVDDLANRVGVLTREFPQLAVCLGGHTHQNHSSDTINNVLYTQADHYGIYAGRVDLTFDRTSRKPVHRSANTVHMDHEIPLDPLILSLAHDDLDAADHVLAQPIGELTETFGVDSSFGQPSDVERLIASGIIATLRQKGVEVDAVMHGLFDKQHAFTPGAKTIADAWTVLPYENQIVTVELPYTDLLVFARELGGASLDPRNLMGLRVAGAATGKTFRVDALLAANGAPLPAKPAYRVALNSYDSQSAGERFPGIGRLVAQPSSRRRLHSIQIRDALIDFFVARQKVSRASLLV